MLSSQVHMYLYLYLYDYWYLYFFLNLVTLFTGDKPVTLTVGISYCSFTQEKFMCFEIFFLIFLIGWLGLGNSVNLNDNCVCKTWVDEVCPVLVLCSVDWLVLWTRPVHSENFFSVFCNWISVFYLPIRSVFVREPKFPKKFIDTRQYYYTKI